MSYSDDGAASIFFISAPASSPAAPPRAADADHMALYARSNSLMFLVYMVIGFSATLGAILTILAGYYFYRCTALYRRARTPNPEASGPSKVLEPKELFVVLHPGGSTEVAFREAEEQVWVPNTKHMVPIPVKCATIELPTSPKAPAPGPPPGKVALAALRINVVVGCGKDDVAPGSAGPLPPSDCHRTCSDQPPGALSGCDGRAAPDRPAPSPAPQAYLAPAEAGCRSMRLQMDEAEPRTIVLDGELAPPARQGSWTIGCEHVCRGGAAEPAAAPADNQPQAAQRPGSMHYSAGPVLCPAAVESLDPQDPLSGRSTVPPVRDLAILLWAVERQMSQAGKRA